VPLRYSSLVAAAKWLGFAVALVVVLMGTVGMVIVLANALR